MKEVKEVTFHHTFAIEEIVLQTKDDKNAFIEQKQLIANEDLSPLLLVFKISRRSFTIESDIH
jgi:hypothetical protein